jgi:hypothetical protein
MPEGQARQVKPCTLWRSAPAGLMFPRYKTRKDTNGGHYNCKPKYGVSYMRKKYQWIYPKRPAEISSTAKR